MNFEIENKVRTLVAEMLLGMNDKLMSTDRSVRKAHQDLLTVESKIKETNNKLDREAKIKDLVEQLKWKIGNMVSSNYNRTLNLINNVFTVNRKKEC